MQGRDLGWYQELTCEGSMAPSAFRAENFGEFFWLLQYVCVHICFTHLDGLRFRNYRALCSRWWRTGSQGALAVLEGLDTPVPVSPWLCSNSTGGTICHSPGIVFSHGWAAQGQPHSNTRTNCMRCPWAVCGRFHEVPMGRQLPTVGAPVQGVYIARTQSSIGPVVQ